MKRTWQLQEAKNQLSVLVDQAIAGGVQTITRHGEPVVVVISATEFKKMAQPKQSLVQFFAECGMQDADWDSILERDKSPAREVEV